MTVRRGGGSVSRHLLANVLGRSWAFLSLFLFVPVYVHILGVANFGVIALFLVVSGVIAFLDLGFSPTLARELHDQRRTVADKNTLLFTYEVVLALIIAALILCALLLPMAAFALILDSKDLAQPEVASSIRFVFVAAAAQMLFNFYVAGLMGVEEHVKGNLVVVTAGVFRGALVIVPLSLYPKPAVYIIWQVVFILVFTVVARHLLYRAIGGHAAVVNRVFDLRVLLENLTFTRSMFLIAIISAIVTQLDKLFLGKIVGIASLGEYSLVSTFSQLPVLIISPVTATLLPRFVRSASVGDTDGVRNLFFVTHRLVAAIVIASVGCMVFFGSYLLEVWTVGKLEFSSVGSYVIPLVVGNALLALNTVPHCVSVANKDVNGILVLSGIGALLAIPAYWYSINRFEEVGAAGTWLLLQGLLYPLYLGWVNRSFMKVPALWRAVFVRTLLLPLSAVLAIDFIASRLVHGTQSKAMNLVIIGTATVIGGAFSLYIALRREDVHFLMGSSQQDKRE